MDLQVKMNTPEHNFDVKSKSTQPLDSRQHMSTNQKDCQGKVNDFFESLMIVRMPTVASGARPIRGPMGFGRWQRYGRIRS